MVIKVASAFSTWKEIPSAVSVKEEMATTSNSLNRPTSLRRPKCLDLGLCCCKNLSHSVDSPLSERELLGGGDSRWVVTEQEAQLGKGGLGRSTSMRQGDPGSRESWFAYAFGNRSKRHVQQESLDYRPGHSKKPSWDGSSIAKLFQPRSGSKNDGQAWWGDGASAPVTKKQQAQPLKPKVHARSGSMTRSVSTKKRAHEVIYSGNAKWKKILRRVLNEARKIHVPAVHIDGPYNYDTLSYLKNFDMCEDVDDKPIRWRSLSTRSALHLQSDLAADRDNDRVEDEGEIVADKSPARKTSRPGSDHGGSAKSLFSSTDSAPASAGSNPCVDREKNSPLWEHRSAVKSDDLLSASSNSSSRSSLQRGQPK